MSSKNFPLIEINGSHYEIGFQHGKQFQEKVRGSIETYKKMFWDYSQIDWDRAKKISETFIPMIEEFNSNYIDEIRGVADGAELEFLDVLALNCRSEIVFAGSEITEVSDGCTSLTVTSEATKTGDAYLGHNWDWKTAQRDNMVMLKIDQGEDLPRIFTITEAGIIGKTGFNSAGIGVVLNALGTNAAPKGIPLHMVMRAILDCETLAEAIKVATKMNIGCCANFMIGHKNGECIDIEIENEDFDVLYPEDGILVHTNHFISPRLPVYPRKDKLKFTFSDSFIRLGRTKKLLKAKKGEIDEKVIMEILSDHVEYPSSICRHDDLKLDPGLRVGTVFSVVVNLTKGEIYFAKGTPCNTEYEKYTV